MDYFAHSFWSYIIFHRTKTPIYAILFGIMPDSLSWMIYLFYRIFSKDLFFGRPDFTSIPDWVFTLYGISHSIIIAGLIFLLVYLIFKKIPIYMYAWPIHILIDIPTHRRDFLPTPFLWPISEWKFPGISWGNKWFMIINWSLILIAVLLIIADKKGWLKKLKSKLVNLKPH